MDAAENSTVKNTPAIVAAVSAVLVAGMAGYAVILNEQTKAKVAASQEASAKFAAEKARLAAEAEEAAKPVMSDAEYQDKYTKAAWAIAHGYCFERVMNPTAERLSQVVLDDFEKFNIPKSFLTDRGVDEFARRIILRNGCREIIDMHP